MRLVPDDGFISALNDAGSIIDCQIMFSGFEWENVCSANNFHSMPVVGASNCISAMTYSDPYDHWRSHHEKRINESDETNSNSNGRILLTQIGESSFFLICYQLQFDCHLEFFRNIKNRSRESLWVKQNKQRLSGCWLNKLRSLITFCLLPDCKSFNNLSSKLAISFKCQHLNEKQKKWQRNLKSRPCDESKRSKSKLRIFWTNVCPKKSFDRFLKPSMVCQTKQIYEIRFVRNSNNS